ncbi:MAG: co-chaperone YbbN [Pseudomonadota bacterium]|nr:co-chaperone YbbN [Pseudomonadota bacterium]
MLSPFSQQTPSQVPAGDAADPVRDVGLSNFVPEVVEASNTYPVAVYFWSPSSAPCKQLAVVLERLVRAHKGAVRLAKIDIDRSPQIAQQMGVQSIPTVFAFFQGRPIDGFMGTLPEAQVKSWLERLASAAGGGAAGQDGLDTALKQAAEFLAENDLAKAQSIYADILDMEPGNVAALGGLMRCALAAGETEHARDMLAQLPADLAKDKTFDPIRTSLDLADQALKSGNVLELQDRVAKNPSDHQARFDLAMAHYAAGQREEAVEALLEIVRRDRKWNEEGARKQLVKFFEAFGATDPLTVAARKRLSSILFA